MNDLHLLKIQAEIYCEASRFKRVKDWLMHRHKTNGAEQKIQKQTQVPWEMGYMIKVSSQITGENNGFFLKTGV